MGGPNDRREIAADVSYRSAPASRVAPVGNGVSSADAVAAPVATKAAIAAAARIDLSTLRNANIS